MHRIATEKEKAMSHVPPEFSAALKRVNAMLDAGSEPPWVWMRLKALQKELEWWGETDGGHTMAIPLDDQGNVVVPKHPNLKTV